MNQRSLPTAAHTSQKVNFHKAGYCDFGRAGV
jgi:hypothetical protein